MVCVGVCGGCEQWRGGEFVCGGKMEGLMGKWRVLYVVVEELKGVGSGVGVEGIWGEVGKMRGMNGEGGGCMGGDGEGGGCVGGWRRWRVYGRGWRRWRV